MSKNTNATATRTLEELVNEVINCKKGTFKGQEVFSSPILFTSYCGKHQHKLTFSFTFNPDKILHGRIGNTYWVIKKENGRVKSVSVIKIDSLEIIATNVPASVAITISSIMNKTTWSAVNDAFKKLAERNDANRKTTSGLHDKNVPATNGNNLL